MPRKHGSKLKNQIPRARKRGRQTKQAKASLTPMVYHPYKRGRTR